MWQPTLAPGTSCSVNHIKQAFRYKCSNDTFMLLPLYLHACRRDMYACFEQGELAPKTIVTLDQILDRQ